MDVLIVEPLDAEVLRWLGARHALHVAPELARDPLAFRQRLSTVRAIIVPPSVTLDASALQRAQRLRAVGRLSVGSENIDLAACALAGIEVVRPTHASATAEAEFVIGALLQLLRRVPVFNDEGLLVGRELGGLSVGLVGMTPAVKPLAELLSAFGARVLGYDPGVHGTDPVWVRSGVTPAALREVIQGCDAVCVLLPFFQRYAGLFGERLLASAKHNQVLVSLAHSALFDEHALAQALTEGPLAAAWFDCLEPGAQDPGRPLRHLDTLQVTPRVSGTTLQSRVRSAWVVARRIDELLSGDSARAQLRAGRPDEFADPVDEPGPA